MDFSKFLDGDFAVKEWVNGALAAHKSTQVPLDAHASTLVMKLQLFIQEVNGVLEETSSNMLQNLPRVLRDVESVRQEATLLREQMQIVKDDIKKVERDTAQSMATLVELDAIKVRMNDSLEALQEADNWTTLSADVEEVFSSQDIAMIAEKLAGMQQSLHVLHDVPDFAERWGYLEGLKDRLEAIISPLLLTSFHTHANDDAGKYVKIFSDIGRESQLQNYYIGCHKGSVTELWRSLSSSSSSSPDSTPLSFLSTFYDELLSKWHSEFVWCRQLVSLEPLSLLPSLFIQALENVSPSLTQSLNLEVQNSPNSSPSTLLPLRQTVLRFVGGLERALGKEEGYHGDRNKDLFRLVECVHAPYCQLLVRYPAMETKMLRQQLHGVDLSLTGVLEEGVAVVSASVSWVFQFASESIDRCIALTGGWGCNGLIKALQTMFSEYVSMLSSGFHQLRRLKSVGEEWRSSLQHVFSLVQVCGDILLRMQALSQHLDNLIITSSPKLQDPASLTNPFGYYDYLAVYHPEEHTRAVDLLHSLEKGKGVWSLLEPLTNQVHGLNEQAHTFAFDLIFSSLKEKLERVPHLQVWKTGLTSPGGVGEGLPISEGLPQFSLSPLSYITEIGDYLLTLPRQLEPFTSQDNPALNHALQHGKLPYLDQQGPLSMDEGTHPSDQWLGAVARGTMATYTQQILHISSLSPSTAQQLTTDIAYLCNVLAALGQVPSQQLSRLERFLTPKSLQDFEELHDSSALYLNVSKLRTW